MSSNGVCGPGLREGELMSGQGYHLAVSEDEAKKLLHSSDQLTILEVINDLLEHMERVDAQNVHGYYKEWDVLHRCLSDGTFDPRGGSYPLNQCFLGGQLLVSEGSIVNLVMPQVVRDIATALERLGRDSFRARFTTIFSPEYSTAIPDEDYELYYQRLEALRQFYARAAAEGKAVVFTTDDSLTDLFKQALQ
jgi:hypothetical protein